MTNEQKTMLGYDWGFALLPYHFNEAITNHCKYNYKNAGIDNVLEAELGSLGKFWKFIEGVSFPKLKEDVLVIFQQENQQNVCLVPLVKGVEKITVRYQNGIKDFDTSKSVFKKMDVCTVDFSFENPITSLELHFNYDVVESLNINVKCELFQKPVIDEKIVLLNNLNVSHSCGNNLVNIKFQNCSGKVVLTKVSLFDDKKQLMGDFKIDEGMLYKSITNLAYGKYFYKVKQLDKENNIIIETDFTEFVLSAPNSKPVIYN